MIGLAWSLRLTGQVTALSRRQCWVQIPQGSPRQKKLTPFRFPGLRKCQESCISVSSFFLPKSNPLRWASIWGGSSRIGVMAARLNLTQEVVVQFHDPEPYGSHTTVVCRSPKPVIVVQIHRPVPYSSVVKMAITPDCLSGDRGFESRRSCHLAP